MTGDDVLDWVRQHDVLLMDSQDAARASDFGDHLISANAYLGSDTRLPALFLTPPMHHFGWHADNRPPHCGCCLPDMGEVAKAKPDVPTVAETGFKDFETPQWYSILVPAGTPRDTVTRLQEESLKALKSNSVTERFASDSAVGGGGPPEEFAAYIGKQQNLGRHRQAGWHQARLKCPGGASRGISPAPASARDHAIAGWARRQSGIGIAQTPT